jgi:hypothetical protein
MYTRGMKRNPDKQRVQRKKTPKKVKMGFPYYSIYVRCLVILSFKFPRRGIKRTLSTCCAQRGSRKLMFFVKISLYSHIFTFSIHWYHGPLVFPTCLRNSIIPLFLLRDDFEKHSHRYCTVLGQVIVSQGCFLLLYCMCILRIAMHSCNAIRFYSTVYRYYNACSCMLLVLNVLHILWNNCWPLKCT